MAATVVVRGSGGAEFEMDVPSSQHRREAFDRALVTGDLVLVADPSGALSPPAVEEPAKPTRRKSEA